MSEAGEPTTKKRARGELKIPVDADDIGEDKVSIDPNTPFTLCFFLTLAPLILINRKIEETTAAAGVICRRRATFARISHGLSAKIFPRDRTRTRRCRWKWTRTWWCAISRWIGRAFPRATWW